MDKRILVFEDIDCMCDVVSDRKKDDAPTLSEKSELQTSIEEIKELAKKATSSIDYPGGKNNNLSNLLNILDGLNEALDRIIIMTSNHPEKLDRALTRSGRIDIKVHFKKASCEEIQEIVGHYWDEPQARELCAKWEHAISAADVVNACRSSQSVEESYTNIEKCISASIVPIEAVKFSLAADAPAAQQR